jgi:hypothetical protein
MIVMGNVFITNGEYFVVIKKLLTLGRDIRYGVKL